MIKKSSRNGNKILIITFLFTLLISSLTAVFFFFPSPNQTIQHLPTTYNFKIPDWMKFVSSDAEKVLMMNLTQIFQKTGNYSLFPSTNLLIISNITTQITVFNSDFLTSILYKNSKPDSEDLVLNIIKPKTNIYSTFIKELEETIRIKNYHMTHIIFQVTRLTTNQPANMNGYITLDDGYLLYSEDTEIIKKSLDNKIGNDHFSEKTDVKGSMYLLLSGKNDELGFSYSTLPYSVNDVASISTSIRYESNSLIIRYVFRFNDTTTASKNLNNIKQANLNSIDFNIIDNFIVTIAKYDNSLLLRELRSL